MLLKRSDCSDELWRQVETNTVFNSEALQLGTAAMLDKLCEIAGDEVAPLLIKLFTDIKASVNVYRVYKKDPVCILEQYGIDIDNLPLNFFDVPTQRKPGPSLLF